MTTSLMPEPRQRYYNNDGTLAAGCLLYTYAAGTTTPKATYQDSDGATPHANPIVLDAKGEAVIYWDGAYKVDLKTSAGVQITGYPVDNYTPPTSTLRTDLATTAGAGLIGFSHAASYAAGTLGKKAQNTVNIGDAPYSAVAGSDSYAAIQAALDALNVLGGGTLRMLPKGVYPSSAQLRTYANVTIDLCGSTIRRDFDTSATGAGLLGVNGSDKENIAVINGTLDGNGQNYDQSHNIFGATDITGLKFDNVRFLNVVDFHAIDISGSSQVRIRDCKFLGFANLSGTRGFSEAIQLDPAGSTDDVLVEGCYSGDNPDNADANFVEWPCLVGNHSLSDSAITVKNVRVIGNHVVGASHGGVSPYAWDQVVISGNTFEDCARAVFLQQGTGTKTQGCVDVAITGNTIKGASTLNAIYAVDNAGTPANSIHRNISITGNTFDGVETCIRPYWVSGLTISGNIARNVTALVTTVAGSQTDAISITGNTIDTASSTVIGLLGEDKSVSVVGNTARNMSGRFLHSTGATDAALRGQLQVNSNTLVDCAGAVFIAVDSGASKDVQINNNNLSQGVAALAPSTGEVIRCTVTGRCEVFDNYVADALIAKVVRVQSGGLFKGRVTGSPEGVVTAGIGSMAFRSDGGASTTLYIKESGTGDTGWVAK